MARPTKLPHAVQVAMAQIDATRRLRLSGGGAAFALAAGLLAGNPDAALSQVPLPAANHVWAGCVLDPESTLGSLQADVNEGIGAESSSEIEVAFVVVYSLETDNDGQSLGPTTSTGPILCTNPDLVDIEQTFQDSPIPGTRADSVDTLDAEDVFILRYMLNGGANDGDIEKVICHTVNDNVDCFRITPLPGGED